MQCNDFSLLTRASAPQKASAIEPDSKVFGPEAENPILLLDVMDTLVHDPFFHEMPKFFNMSLQELLEHKHPTNWFEFEKGRMSEEEFLQSFFKDGRPYDCEAFLDYVYQSYRWLDGIEDLLRELVASGVEMHALSNYPDWYKMVDKRLGLSQYVQLTFVSCSTGVRKPDPSAYLGAAEKLGVGLDQCVFVDDQSSNVLAARSVGMHAIQFKGAMDLRQRLVQMGVLTLGGCQS
eukprot:CAMPEP_0184332288 /NCGR_PEP_ID=MMETSP1089-20130417/1480_1 /TAXON_ID=38269 ORGANISM="Gloeochaete wittrockiana, Strain SAG46.84" /NCGR_SAMPLE_ID=MMETSP1089 /ASSEMBLY_ACC=CAM_ASM_000445 /LENGTH=233 /DNA_ID=CAMNT_0026655581 /DNA_START=221 /DNA_END=922 /DNA_ORIENTATION=+